MPDKSPENNHHDANKAKLLSLKHGESCIISPYLTISDCGSAEVWHINGMLFLFEIPQYGGQPVFNSAYRTDKIDDLLHTIDFWT